MSEPFNDIREVEMAIKAAQRIVGQATMSMDEEQLAAATDAVNQAKDRYKRLYSQGANVDEQFFEYSQELIDRLDHQLEEAKK